MQIAVHSQLPAGASGASLQSITPVLKSIFGKHFDGALTVGVAEGGNGDAYTVSVLVDQRGIRKDRTQSGADVIALVAEIAADLKNAMAEDTLLESSSSRPANQASQKWAGVLKHSSAEALNNAAPFIEHTCFFGIICALGVAVAFITWCTELCVGEHSTVVAAIEEAERHCWLPTVVFLVFLFVASLAGVVIRQCRTIRDSFRGTGR